MQKRKGPIKGPGKGDVSYDNNIVSPIQLLPTLFYICKENYFMKMNLLEFLDRTGKHVSRKFFEKYKDEKKSFAAWEVLFNIYETYR